MDTKLTLKLNKQVIDRAKNYAAAHHRSLSGIIEAYLQSLVGATETKNADEIEISPFVKSLATGVSIPLNLDYKKEYSDFLAEKHK